MVQQKVLVRNKSGLHARPAHEFITVAKGFPCRVAIRKGGAEYNGKSILKVLCAGVCKDDEIEIACDGRDEAEALAALIAAVESGLGEDE